MVTTTIPKNIKTDNRNVGTLAIIWPIVYLAALVALPIIRNEFGYDIPNYILYPFKNMPLSVLWFGSLGGMIVSLYSIFADHAWTATQHVWHAFSGVIGAVYGLISYLLIVLLINATTINDHFSRTTVAYDVIAFIFGFSQTAISGSLKGFAGRFSNRER